MSVYVEAALKVVTKDSLLSRWARNSIMLLEDFNKATSQQMMLTRAFWYNSSLRQFFYMPVSQKLMQITNWFAKEAEVAIEDDKQYLITVKSRIGIHGWGYYTSNKVLIFETGYNREIENLLRTRRKKEPVPIMGTRDELMRTVKGLTNDMFNSACTMDYFRAEAIRSDIDKYVDGLETAEHHFRNWLQTQVNNGSITEIDGFRFVDKRTIAILPVTIGAASRGETGEEVIELLPKNCEVGDFIYRYLHSLRLGAKVKLCEDIYTVDDLSRRLYKKVMYFTNSIEPDVKFLEINKLIMEQSEDHALQTRCVIKTVN